MKVLGLDPSTKTGVVLLQGEKPQTDATVLEASMWENKKLAGFDRVFWMRDRLIDLLDKHAPEMAVLEGYGFANANSLVPLVEIGTILRLTLLLRGVKTYTLPPTSLKKFVTGSGNSPKNKMLLEVYRRWGYEAKDDNVADGYGLAMAGLVFSNAINCKNNGETLGAMSIIPCSRRQ